MRALVVDDDRVVARGLERLLRREGYEVRMAHDGEQAWQLFQQEPVPLVLTDWLMPHMDGIELCRRLRAHACEGYVYLIMLTGSGDETTKLMALEAGADDFLYKPVNSAELRARLSVARRILEMEERLRTQSQHLQSLNEELKARAEELEHSQRLLIHANRRFTELFENLPIACFTFDAEGTLHEWNQAAEQLFGYPKQQVLFRPVYETVFREGATADMRSLVEGVLAGETVRDKEPVEIPTASGQIRSVMRSAFPLSNPNGEVVGGIVAVVDASDRVEYERHLQRMALADGLTGIPNHRAFQDFLRQQLAEAQRHNRPLSLILLDVDHFKRLNDTYGHLVGDEVLKQVARILVQTVRQSDFVARYGGEEFAVVLPSTDLTSALTVAERLREAIAAGAWEALGSESCLCAPQGPVTASFGVASYQPGMASPQELIEAADQALYRAKASGRNCVCAAEPSESRKIGAGVE